MCCWPAFKSQNIQQQQQQESRQTQMGRIKGKEWITSKEHTYMQSYALRLRHIYILMSNSGGQTTTRKTKQQWNPNEMQHRRSITSSSTDALRIIKTLLKSTKKESKRVRKPHNMAGISSKLYSSSREREREITRDLTTQYSSSSVEWRIKKSRQHDWLSAYLVIIRLHTVLVKTISTHTYSNKPSKYPKC